MLKLLKKKRLIEFLQFDIDENIELDDSITISLKDIGHISFSYIYSGYWMFENDMTEEEYDEYFFDEPFININELFIEPTYRYNGYAKILLQKALDYIKKEGIKIIYLNASPMGLDGLNKDQLVKFYKSFGFKILNDKYNNNTEMIKYLD